MRAFGCTVYFDLQQGDQQCVFDCGHSLEEQSSCPFFFGYTMPPNPGDECTNCCSNGECASYEAKVAAMKKVVANAKDKIKELEHELEEARY